MRDPNRLDNIYEQMCKDHKEVVPDWRMGQLLLNFMGDYVNTHGQDPFYVEDSKFMEAWNDFIKRMKG